MQENNKNNNDEFVEIRRLINDDPEDTSDKFDIDDILSEFGDEYDLTDDVSDLSDGISETLSDPEPESVPDDEEQELPVNDDAASTQQIKISEIENEQDIPDIGDDELNDIIDEFISDDEPEIVSEEDSAADLRARKEAELNRRREELKRANERNNALADEIASNVDAAMDEKKGGQGENTARIPTPSTRISNTLNPTGGFSPRPRSNYSDEPKPESYDDSVNSRFKRVSSDLHAFVNLNPDDAALKAKRAVSYYSWCSAALMFFTVISWYITSAPTYKAWLPDFLTYSERPYITLLVLAFIQCISMFIARSFVADGLRSLLKFDFKAETLLTVSSVVTLFYTISIIVFPAWGGYLPCVPCSLFGLFVGLFARRQRYRSVRGSCRAASRSDSSYSVIKGMRDASGTVRTVYKTEPSSLKREFMDSILEEDQGEAAMHYFVPIVLIVTLLFALISSIGTAHGTYFLWHWSTLLSVAAPAGIILSQVVPFAAVSNKLSRIGVALMGGKGITDIADTQSAILKETDVFPTKMITVNGVKVFSGFTKEKVNLCTLSVLKASDSSIYDAFAASLPDQPMNLPPVEGFEYYETGGMGAYVNGEKVLVGTANFILRMAVKVPEGINLKNGILVAINMQFAGVFTVKYDVQPSVRRALSYMIKHKITPIMALRDFNMTPQLLENRFKINAEDFNYPDLEHRIAYCSIKNSEMDDACAVAAVNILHSFSEAVCCGKRVRNSMKLNMTFGYISACIGIALIFYLLFMQSYTVVTPANIFYYLLLFFAPVLLSAFGANRR